MRVMKMLITFNLNCEECFLNVVIMLDIASLNYYLKKNKLDREQIFPRPTIICLLISIQIMKFSNILK